MVENESEKSSHRAHSSMKFHEEEKKHESSQSDPRKQSFSDKYEPNRNLTVN